MKHEDIQIDKQYTINKDKPFNAEVIKGEQVVVKAFRENIISSIPHHFVVESLRYHAPGMPRFTWIVTADDLDEANPDWVDPYAPEPELPQEDLGNQTPAETPQDPAL